MSIKSDLSLQDYVEGTGQKHQKNSLPNAFIVPVPDTNVSVGEI